LVENISVESDDVVDNAASTALKVFDSRLIKANLSSFLKNNFKNPLSSNEYSKISYLLDVMYGVDVVKYKLLVTGLKVKYFA
jgi:hypothetical protein